MEFITSVKSSLWGTKRSDRTPLVNHFYKEHCCHSYLLKNCQFRFLSSLLLTSCANCLYFHNFHFHQFILFSFVYESVFVNLFINGLCCCFKNSVLVVTFLPHLFFRVAMVLLFCCKGEFWMDFFIFYEFGSTSNHCFF